jgi:hypothetical protein
MSVAATFGTPLDAELARLMLDEQDIASRLEGDLLSGAALPIWGAESVRLLVAAEHAERAQELIRKYERELSTERRRADSADQRVGRAYRLALVGLLLLPVVTQLVSLVQLLRVSWSALSSKARRQYVVALSFDALVLGSAAYWLACRHNVELPVAADSKLPVPALPD